MDKITRALIESRRDDIIRFGEAFFTKLCDPELIDSLAEKDLEKLARVFKIVFDRLGESEDKPENETLLSLINAVNGLGSVNEDE